MKMKIRTIITSAAVLCVGATAFAQNLDPTVNVTRDYEGKLLEVDKPALRMNVPDSVTRFNLDFGYSVRESAYKGSYEFVPYVLEMQPDPDAYRENKLWLRAGLGYTLHPTLDVVYSPHFSNRFRMSLYGLHRSYYGPQRQLTGLMDGTVAALPSDDHIRRTAAWYCDKNSDDKKIRNTGYDMLTRAGVNGRYDWLRGCFTFDASYFGIATSNMYGSDKLARHYDAAEVKFRARSVQDDMNYFFWDVALNFRGGTDNLNGYMPAAMTGFGGKVNELWTNFDASLGPVFRGRNAVLVDVDGDAVVYGESLQSHIARLAITPKYVLTTDRVTLEAGVRVDMMMRPKEDPNPITGNPMNTGRGQVLYPMLKFDWAVIPNWLDLYARIGGGNDINPYSRMIERNHHFSAAYQNTYMPLLENTVEKVSSAIGVRGQINRRYFWDLNGGWLYNAGAPLDALNGSLPTIYYVGYQCAFASLKFGVRTQDVDIDGWLNYKWTNVYHKAKMGAVGFQGVFEPSRLCAGVKAVYNWKRRIYAGVSCDGSVNRRASLSDTKYFVPWYADLGLNFEYRFNKKLSFWAEGGNLLNQSIQRDFGYTETGVNFTVGICLNL